MQFWAKIRILAPAAPFFQIGWGYVSSCELKVTFLLKIALCAPRITFWAKNAFWAQNAFLGPKCVFGAKSAFLRILVRNGSISPLFFHCLAQNAKSVIFAWNFRKNEFPWKINPTTQDSKIIFRIFHKNSIFDTSDFTTAVRKSV